MLHSRPPQLKRLHMTVSRPDVGQEASNLQPQRTKSSEAVCADQDQPRLFGRTKRAFRGRGGAETQSLASGLRRHLPNLSDAPGRKTSPPQGGDAAPGPTTRGPEAACGAAERNPGKWSRVSGLTADFIHALYSSERCHMNCCSQYLISLWLNTGLLNIKAPHQKTCVKEGGSEETR